MVESFKTGREVWLAETFGTADWGSMWQQYKLQRGAEVSLEATKQVKYQLTKFVQYGATGYPANMLKLSISVSPEIISDETAFARTLSEIIEKEYRGRGWMNVINKPKIASTYRSADGSLVYELTTHDSQIYLLRNIFRNAVWSLKESLTNIKGAEGL